MTTPNAIRKKTSDAMSIRPKARSWNLARAEAGLIFIP
jgi:hypothetical protein